MSNVTPMNPDGPHVIKDDQGRHIDAFGQMLLVGIFSDLCQLRDREHQTREVGAIIKRLESVIARYEPDGAA